MVDTDGLVEDDGGHFVGLVLVRGCHSLRAAVAANLATAALAVGFNQAYFFTTFPANPANGFAGTLSYFDFVELFWPKCLSYFAKMLELFSENA